MSERLNKDIRRTVFQKICTGSDAARGVVNRKKGPWPGGAGHKIYISKSSSVRYGAIGQVKGPGMGGSGTQWTPCEVSEFLFEPTTCGSRSHMKAQNLADYHYRGRFAIVSITAPGIGWISAEEVDRGYKHQVEREREFIG